MDFFSNHGVPWLQLLCWALFPRLSFWFMSSITGGFWFWLGVLFVPRIMCAFWATTFYWHTNPGVCVCAWLVAAIGERTENTKPSEHS